MPDMLFSAEISRDILGLGPLDLNDHTAYYVARDNFWTGTTSWNRNQVGSPFIDGQVTVYRTRQMITQPMTIEVRGFDFGDLNTKITTLIEAFSQDTFDIQYAFDTHVLQYACEAADYTVGWIGSRFIAQQVQVTFNVPVQPDPVAGGF